MAYKFFDDFSSNFVQSQNGEERISALSENNSVSLPDKSFVRDADMSRDGIDLILEANGETIIIEGYFAIEPTPNLTAPDGTTLTPDLVNSFTRGGNEYASAELQTNDASPVGAVQEISGEATVTRLDGTVETIGLGTPIYPGDIVETDEQGAVNIMFIDETTFAVSEDARLAIDEYIFDPATQSGTSNFSVLKGVFVFTSGLIGRDDPDDVMIDTPSGSIGIRGTIIAGDVDAGEITVIEGAIVLTDFNGNSATLANQYETARFNPSENTIEPLGTLAAEEISSKFMSVSTVAADLFSSIEDSTNDNNTSNENGESKTSAPEEADTQEPADEEAQQMEEGDKEASLDESAADQKELITSNDITKGDEIPTAEPKTDTTITSKGVNIPKADTAEASDNPAPAPKIAPQQDTPFTIAVETLPVNEGASDIGVALVKGNFTKETNLQLIGPSNNFYEIERIDENNLLIKLKAGINIDAEKPFPLTIAASNASGATIITDKIDVNVNNTIDDPTLFIGTLPNNAGNIDNAFAGSDNSEFTYNFGHDFIDADGDIATYQFTPGTIPTGINTGSINFNTSTGVLSFSLDPSIPADDTFTFTINALNSIGTTINTQNFDYDVYSATTSATTIGTGEIYSGTDGNITIIGSNSKIFTDSDNGSNTISVNSFNNQIKTGGGDDTINFGPGTNGNYAFGDHGNDLFQMNSVQNHAYGDEGNDSFNINSGAEVTTLESAGAGTITMDGGDGFDTFHLSTDDNIDFTAINDGFIQNIERLGMVSNGDQTITLSYTDVVAMTDDHNTIRIDMDSNDTLNFNNNNANGYDFYQVGSDSQYNIYTDGIVTLMVNADTTNVTGII